MSDMAHKTTETQSAVIVSDHGGVLLRISAGGLWVNPDIPADECAQRVLASLRPILSHTIDTEVQIQVARLTAERDAAQAEVERLTRQNSENFAEIERLKNAIDHLTSERDEARDERDAVQRERERLTARQTEMETHITGLTTELHRTRADGIELRWVAGEVEQLTAQRDAAQAEVERLKEQVAALTLAVEQADEMKAHAEAAAAWAEAQTDRVVADGNKALAEVERLTVELHETREKLTRVQVQYDEFAKVTAKVIDQHQRERDHARQQVYRLQQAGAGSPSDQSAQNLDMVANCKETLTSSRPTDEDIWREAFMRQLHDHHAPNWATTADAALAEYRKRWPR